MTRTKRLSALILTIIMMISIIPVTSMAAGENGWKKEDGSWYYYKDGEKVKDQWIKDGGKWYYLYSTGEMAADTVIPDSEYKSFYYVGKDGAMISKQGWRKITFTNEGVTRTYWMYIKKGGALTTGWKKISGKWYYFAIIMLTGEMLPGGTAIEGKYYFFNKDGSMKSKCWAKDTEGYWYYLTKSGAAQTGWKLSGGKWYYLDPAEYGRCVTDDWKEVDGKWYEFDANGVCLNPKGADYPPYA